MEKCLHNTDIHDPNVWKKKDVKVPSEQRIVMFIRATLSVDLFTMSEEWSACHRAYANNAFDSVQKILTILCGMYIKAVVLDEWYWRQEKNVLQRTDGRQVGPSRACWGFDIKKLFVANDYILPRCIVQIGVRKEYGRFLVCSERIDCDTSEERYRGEWHRTLLVYCPWNSKRRDYCSDASILELIEGRQRSDSFTWEYSRKNSVRVYSKILSCGALSIWRDAEAIRRTGHFRSGYWDWCEFVSEHFREYNGNNHRSNGKWHNVVNVMMKEFV